MYCEICASYGHIVDDCPNKKAKALRQGKSAKGIENLVLKISSNEEDIKQFIKSVGLQPATRQMENRKLLRDYANSLVPPRMIQLIGSL
jgi:hypothetical protein